ncbi:hypothetical protein E0H26_28115 [Micromonospora zingiberis]|uniref:Uncharacterized protein n=1 Tax=Micromonospora zingiberis TaxID=2053011 RepID=A0A4R0FYR8_9ACTN|nr:hypothetical protein [Micromonospora zingiberis]TCB89280.1 hypothetical protein E0H26_28115 [Micromonospora zingiberis]
MAELLLLADPKHFQTNTDGVSLAFDFDSIADLRSWLHLAGLTDPDMLTAERTGTTDDGRPYRTMYAYPTWHGWEIYAYAKEYTSGPALAPATVDRLSALAVEG